MEPSRQLVDWSQVKYNQNLKSNKYRFRPSIELFGSEELETDRNRTQGIPVLWRTPSNGNFSFN